MMSYFQLFTLILTSSKLFLLLLLLSILSLSFSNLLSDRQSDRFCITAFLHPCRKPGTSSVHQRYYQVDHARDTRGAYDGRLHENPPPPESVCGGRGIMSGVRDQGVGIREQGSGERGCASRGPAGEKLRDCASAAFAGRKNAPVPIAGTGALRPWFHPAG